LSPIQVSELDCCLVIDGSLFPIIVLVPLVCRRVLEFIEGPFAVIYLHLATEQLLFSRDPVAGRRSLVMHR
jgi:hypothetical protein